MGERVTEPVTDAVPAEDWEAVPVTLMVPEFDGVPTMTEGDGDGEGVRDGELETDEDTAGVTEELPV